MSDQALVAACGVGDDAARGALFDRHHRAVRRFLARLAGTDARDLDDLVQATFLEVLRAAARFDGRSAVSSWIFGIAANVVRHHVRGEVRRRALLASVAQAPPPARTPPPDLTAERRELVARVAVALQALPHDLRVVFVMCDLEEIPGVEAARILGLRQGTLWRRLHEARRLLRETIERRTP